MFKQLAIGGWLTAAAIGVGAQDNYSEISLPDLMKKKERGERNMVIVDVRTAGEFHDSSSRGKQGNIGRIKDAIHIELRELQSNPEAIKRLEPYRDKDIYLLCSHSYRSRSASNILLKNGYPHVNNVRGGMTEWFRRYEDLAPYRAAFYETSNQYRNVSAAELADDLVSGRNPLLIGISSTPRFFFDTATIRYYTYFPMFKNAVFYNATDSAMLLEAAKKEKGRSIVLFNMVNNGAAELADWLASNGIANVSYLVGGFSYFYEHVRNKEIGKKMNPLLTRKSGIEFITSPNFCKTKNIPGTVLVDLRNDSLYEKVNDGIRYDFKHAAGSVNFFSGQGSENFLSTFPDKSKRYVLMSQNGVTGLEMADELVKKGYRIEWLMGGLQRLEWYTINVEDFGCKEILVK